MARPASKRAASKRCSVKGCNRRHYSLGYCQTHWTHVRESGKPKAIRPYRKLKTVAPAVAKRAKPPSAPKRCYASGCTRPYYASGYCQTHWRHVRETGAPREIHPYRKRLTTTKVAGLRVSPECAEQLLAVAKQTGMSPHAVMTAALDQWAGSVALRRELRQQLQEAA